MTLTWEERAAQYFETQVLGCPWRTPGEMAAEFFPSTVRTPALDLIDEALVKLDRTPNTRLIITMPPQEGKSTRVARDFVLWSLSRHPSWKIIGASYGQALATRNGRSVRRLVERYSRRLGFEVAPDNGGVNDWSVKGYENSGLLSTSIGGGVTGHKCDLMVIDDPIKSRIEADSEVYRNRVFDWWRDEASSRFGASTSVVLILTRWHHDDLAGRLIKEGGWEVLNIPAQAPEKPDPEHPDPLGREPGEYMISARGRTQKQWDLRKKTAGTRGWASLYQGRPTPDTGNLFPRDGWARYELPLWVERPDGSRIVPDVGRTPDTEMVQSWDFTFKDTKSSDYVVGQVWLRRGSRAFLLDQVRGRMSFTESLAALENMTARWPQAIMKLVEDKANGPAILNALHGKIGGLLPVNPEGSKYARAVAVTPFAEAHDVVLPDPILVEGTAWVADLTEEAADFPGGTHDDTVDALSQAVHRLLNVPIIGGDVYDAGDLLGEDEMALAWETWSWQ